MAKTSLPSHLYDTYRQYKHADSVILRWIQTTAANIRLRAQSNSTHSSSRGRAQSNKGRKGTKNAGALNPLDSDYTNPKVSLRALLRFVQEIANSGVTIPPSHLCLLEFAIKLRKSTAAFFSEDATVEEANKTHQFAIDAYSRALEILKEAVRARSKKDGSSKKTEETSVATYTDDTVFGLVQAVNHLTLVVEEDIHEESEPFGSAENEWLRDNPSIAQKEKLKQSFRPSPLEDYELVIESTPDARSIRSGQKAGAFEAISCFIMDLNRIRQYLNGIWRSVAPAGPVSLVSASFVTNHAIQLIKHREYALNFDFPELKDLEDCYSLILKTLFDPEASSGPKITMDSETFQSFRDRIMYDTTNLIRQFQGMVLGGNSFPILRDGHWGYFHPSTNPERLSPLESLNETRCVMGLHLPDILLAQKICSRGWGNFIGSFGLGQEFMAAVTQPPKPVSWTLVFAAQMQADCVQARRRYLRYDVQVMKSLAKRVITGWDDFLSDGVLYDDNMDEVTARPFVRLKRSAFSQWTQDDLIMKSKIANENHLQSPQSCQKDSLFVLNPWLNANVVSELLQANFEAGIGIVAPSGFVASAIQLWNMLNQCGHLNFSSTTVATSKLIDSPNHYKLLFNHLTDAFGHKVFSGGAPKSSFLVQWELLIGVRAEALAKGNRYANRMSHSRHDTHHAYGRGINGPHISEAWTLHSKKYFTADKAAKPPSAASHPLAGTLKLVNSELGFSSSDSESRGSNTAPLGPLLNLDLFKIHALCVRLFTELEPVMRPLIEQRVLRGPLEHNQINWPFITGWIARSETLRPDKKPDPVLLAAAAEVVRRVVGDKEVRFYVLQEEADEGLIIEYDT